MSIEAAQIDAPPDGAVKAPSPLNLIDLTSTVQATAANVATDAANQVVGKVKDDVLDVIDRTHQASIQAIADGDNGLSQRISKLEDQAFAAAANALADPWIWRIALAVLGAFVLLWAGFLFAGSVRAGNLWELAVAALGAGGAVVAKVKVASK